MAKTQGGKHATAGHVGAGGSWSGARAGTEGQNQPWGLSRSSHVDQMSRSPEGSLRVVFPVVGMLCLHSVPVELWVFPRSLCW